MELEFEFPRPSPVPKPVCARYRRIKKNALFYEFPGLYSVLGYFTHRVGNLYLDGLGDYKIIAANMAVRSKELVGEATVNPNAVAGLLLLLGQPVFIADEFAGNAVATVTYNPGFRVTITLRGTSWNDVIATSTAAAVLDCVDLTADEFAAVVNAYSAIASSSGLPDFDVYKLEEYEDYRFAFSNTRSCILAGPAAARVLKPEFCRLPGKPFTVKSSSLAELLQKNSWLAELAEYDEL